MSTFEQIERREAQKASAAVLREGVPADREGNRDCRMCKHHSEDAFFADTYCAHPNAKTLSGDGIDFDQMHTMALCDNKRAQLFEHQEGAAPELPEGPGVISEKPARSLTELRDRINVAFAEIAIQELGFTEDGPDADTYGLSEKGLEHGGDLMVEKVEELYVSKAEHDRRVTELLRANNENVERRRALKRQLEEDARDAARWRAIVSGGRIRMFGSANVDTGIEGRCNERTDGWVHFGAEFWSTYDLDGMPEEIIEQNEVHRKWGQNALTALADDIIARGEA